MPVCYIKAAVRLVGAMERVQDLQGTGFCEQVNLAKSSCSTCMQKADRYSTSISTYNI